MRNERFAGLSALQPGWLNGLGKAVKDENIMLAQEIVAETVKRGVELPSIFPTEDGGVSLEWNAPGAHLGVEVVDAKVSVDALSASGVFALYDDIHTADETALVIQSWWEEAATLAA